MKSIIILLISTLLPVAAAVWALQEWRLVRWKRRSALESQRLRLILDHLNETIFYLNLDAQILYCSPFLQRIMGEPSSTLVGTSAFDLLHPEDVPLLRSIHETCIQERRIFEVEHRSITPKGQVIHLESRGIPVLAQDGQLQGVLVISRNISDRKIADEQIRRNDRLTALGQLSAGIAHEIRNPLTSLKGFIQLLREGKTNNPLYYTIMLDEIARLESIAGEFLLLSKPKHISMGAHSLTALVRKTVDLLTMQALLKNVQLHYRMPNEPCMIRCDENHIRQVLINLVKNALEATSEQGIVELELSRRGDQWVVRIKDDGPGMSKEVLSRLGEPFLTTKEKGTGLGLMVCFNIVRAHQGELHFSNGTDRGLIVEMVLPEAETPNA